MICAELGYKDWAEERQLEEKGWIKISRKPPYVPEIYKKQIFANDLNMTKKQADTLIDLGFSSDNDFKLLVEINEKRW